MWWNLGQNISLLDWEIAKIQVSPSNLSLNAMVSYTDKWPQMQFKFQTKQQRERKKAVEVGGNEIMGTSRK